MRFVDTAIRAATFATAFTAASAFSAEKELPSRELSGTPDHLADRSELLLLREKESTRPNPNQLLTENQIRLRGPAFKDSVVSSRVPWDSSYRQTIQGKPGSEWSLIGATTKDHPGTTQIIVGEKSENWTFNQKRIAPGGTAEITFKFPESGFVVIFFGVCKGQYPALVDSQEKRLHSTSDGFPVSFALISRAAHTPVAEKTPAKSLIDELRENVPNVEERPMRTFSSNPPTLGSSSVTDQSPNSSGVRVSSVSVIQGETFIVE